ncbi:EAL domain-containing protein [uncultured Desulfovibrio sp.]|uniref:EAL domain-containing protein n=1 Tax=uncultured Desulfovibrio sp. TaxID=167968 RepID=UPI00260E404E|nr:EAL domain-containing protein [uncultured Desulfovibrio sp.]
MPTKLHQAILLLLLLLPFLPFFAGLSHAEPLPQPQITTANPTFHFFSPEALIRNQREKKIVRVGWLNLPEIFQERRGRMTGYAVELLQAISTYTGWQYEWIKSTTKELPDQLRRKEIDISCGLILDPLKANDLEYAKYPAGYKSFALHVPRDSSIRYMNFEDLEGKHIGMLHLANVAAIVREFSRHYRFSFQPRYYPAKKQMHEALLKGEIDGYIEDSLHGDQTKIAAILTVEPFFFVTGKDSELLPQLNEALKQIYLFSPWILSNLFENYVHGWQGISYSRTRAEEEWLATRPRLRVAYSRQQSMMDRSQPGSNFLIRLMEELSRRSGIAFDYVPAPTYKEALQWIQEGKADMVSSIFAGLALRMTPQLLVSRPYYNMPLSLIGDRKAVPGSGIRVGASHEMLSPAQAYKTTYPDDTIIYYDAPQQGLEALAHRNIDAYLIGYANATGTTPHLPPNAVTLSNRAVYPMSLGFCQDISPYALSLLTRTIMSMSAAEMEALLMDSTPRSRTDLFFSVLKENSVGLLLSGIFLFAAIILGVLYVNRRHMHSLEEVAYRDPLTGGNNRAKFLHDAHRLLLLHRQARHPFYLLLFNVRRLKLINRTRGHQGGDALIRHTYRLLHAQLHENELLGHATAGKFLVLWQCPNDDILRRRIEEVFAATASARQKIGSSVILSCGVTALVPYDGDIHNCLLRAETAESSIPDDSYHSKYMLYDARLEASLLKQNELENRMVGALRNGEFQVYMQPQHNLSDGSLHGAEALIRWLPPKERPIYPDEFIPLFERNGFIRELDLFVLRTVCSWLQSRREAGLPVSCVSINQSKALFFSSDYVRKFLKILAAHDIPTSLIVLEITESMAWLDEGLFTSCIAELKANGVRLALDDFGKGYASLAALQSFDLDIIKLDKAFLDNAAEEKEAANVIISSVISMGKRLHLFMLCEGIETPEQRDFLARMGCDCGQGYFFARPMPLEEYSRYVDEHLPAPATT